MTFAEFEEKLARHCAPVLAGIKPANLFSVGSQEDGDLEQLVSSYQAGFQKQGIWFRILCRCSERTLILVYRPAFLLSCLENREARELLERFGYPAAWGQLPLEALLDCLACRIQERKGWGFPHEIGLFLGYPIADVMGFIQNWGNNYLYSGYWKVYSDVQAARQQFARYETVKAEMLRILEKGIPIYDILGAGRTAERN